MNVTKKDLGIFSLVLSLILALISLKFSKSGNALTSGYFLVLSSIALAIGMVQPLFITPIYYLFSMAGRIVGFVVTTLVLSIIFYCVFTLIGVILKLTKKDILGLKIDKRKSTYWIDREKTAPERSSLERQF